MPVELPDSEILDLIAEEKVLPADYRQKLRRMTERFKHHRVNLQLQGMANGRYTIMLRQSLANPLDFSAILGYRLTQSTRVFRLLRYNGASHRHTNRIEKVSFRGFHIHRATARYQALGGKEDAYAEPSDRFSSLDSAIDCLLRDCHCQVADDPNQPSLFSGG